MLTFRDLIMSKINLFCILQFVKLQDKLKLKFLFADSGQ